MTSLGLQEVINYCFVSEDLVGDDTALKISNTISKEWQYLRTSLLPGLAQTAAANLNLGSDAKVFEIGKVYPPRPNDLPNESYRLGLVGNSFAMVKGYVESVMSQLDIDTASYSQGVNPYLAEDSSTVVKVGSKKVGNIGTLNPEYRTKTGLKRSLFLAEIDFDELVKLIPDTKTFRPVPKFPSIREDISLVVPVETAVSKVVEATTKSTASYLVGVEPIDIFADEKLGSSKKSVSLRLTFRSNEKTLTDAEVRLEVDKVTKVLKAKLQAKLR
jgi:phenylalanyl-tRNA synthetase beta chain